jgi:hypothetical protein
VNGSPIDPERLGALLEGRLTERERGELLAQLAASGEALEDYADAVAVTDELEREDAAAARADDRVRADGPAEADAPRVIPLRPSTRRAGWRARPWLAAAASVAAVALGMAGWELARGRAAGEDDPGRYAALLARPGLPAGWDAAPWTAARSPDETLDPHARAVRVGARITDLEAAAAAGDSLGARQAAADLGALLGALPAGGPAASVYGELRRRAGEPAAALAPLRQRGRRTAARLAGEEGVALGAWAEGARLAAARRDEGFFRSDAARGALERFIRPTAPPEVRAGAEGIRAALASTPPGWDAVAREAARVLAAAGA